MTRRTTKKLSAVLVSLLFTSTAFAGLGGIQVRSSLGEALQANIALSGSDADEADKLRVSLASPSAFRDLNIDYSPVVGTLRFAVVRQGGKPYIRVMSSQAIHDPYLRFVIEARTPTGRSLREYTVLLDPADYALRQPVLEQDLPLVAKRAPRAATQQAKPLRAGSVEIAAGQTLMSLARSARPPQASLSQTMAAIFKANPHAFVAGNPERMLAGAQITIPGAARIAAINPQEASRLMSGNPGDVGRELATIPAPVKPVAAPKASPAAAPVPAPAPLVAAVAPPVQAPVSTPPAGSPAIKLSAPEAGGDEPAARLSALEQEIANRDRSLQQTQEKIAQLENRLKQMQIAAQSVVVPEEESSFTDGLFSQLPLIGGGLAALALALFGVNIARKRREAARMGAAFGARPLGGGTGLQHGALSRTLQTGAANGNSFLTDFTRSGMGSIDAGEVDPVAEAEVYLAYGRDQQAEDILQDALSKDPTRHEVRLKLLEIYATRGDKATFEQHAHELKLALDGKGALWAKAAALGRSLDPQNPLYADQDSMPLASAPLVAAAGSMIDLDAELSAMMPAAVAAPAQNTLLDFDTPLSESVSGVTLPASDADLDDDPLRAALFGEEPAPPAVAATPALDAHTLEFDLDAMLGDMNAPAAPEASAPVIRAAPAADDNLLDFDFQLGNVPAEPEPVAKPVASNDGFDSLFEFDMGSDASGQPSLDALTADLEAEFAPVSTAGMDVSDDPLSTKLDLARVYLDMGDKEGAREVLLELMGEAEGLLHKEAETLLATL